MKVACVCVYVHLIGKHLSRAIGAMHVDCMCVCVNAHLHEMALD